MTNKIPTEELYEKAFAILRKRFGTSKISDLSVFIDKDGLWVGYFEYCKIRGRVAWFHLIQKDCFYQTNYRSHGLDPRPFRNNIIKELENPRKGAEFPLISLLDEFKQIAKLYGFDIIT